jgi:hypothetical protein
VSEFIVMQASWESGSARVALDDFATTTEAVTALAALLETVGYAKESIKLSLEEVARGY